MYFLTTFNSPVGFLVIKSNGAAITEIHFSETDVPEKHSCAVLEACCEQLHNYFSGKAFSFDLPLKPEGTKFQQKVWAELLKIPYGETITYHELALRLGDTKVIRAAGTANGKNPIAIAIPCHRVIGAGNKLTGYAGGLWRKKWLLEHELNYNPDKRTLF